MQKYHHFIPLEDSERLSYEFLNVENMKSLVEMFNSDKSIFVDNRFKSIETTKQYVADVISLQFDAKHGACDFLIKLKRSKQYIGILHLFDFSTENFFDNLHKCTIGFAISKPYRHQYFATEAVKHLLKYAHQNYHKTHFLSYTNRQNNKANSFLLHLGMKLSNEEYIFGGYENNYYTLQV